MACGSFHLIQINDNRHSVSKTDVESAKVVAIPQQERKSLSKSDIECVASAETA
jgi:hypothetical protein